MNKICLRTALFGVLCLCQVAVYAQYANTTASATVTIHVARNASISCSVNLYFAWMVKGASRTISPDAAIVNSSSPSLTPGGPALFLVKGEPTSTIFVSFPVSTILTLRDEFGDIVPGNSITFDRSNVLYNRSPNGSTPSQGAATTFVSGASTINSFVFLGAAGSASTPTTAFWLGGTILVPVGVGSGYYEGEYTVTLSGYAM